MKLRILRKLRLKAIELSTTDKGYIVKFDFTFHGVTKELTGKLFYDGKTVTGTGATAKMFMALASIFNFLLKLIILITSN